MRQQALLLRQNIAFFGWKIAPEKGSSGGKGWLDSDPDTAAIPLDPSAIFIPVLLPCSFQSTCGHYLPHTCIRTTFCYSCRASWHFRRHLLLKTNGNRKVKLLPKMHLAYTFTGYGFLILQCSSSLTGSLALLLYSLSEGLKSSFP